ncbi:hypothetical protein N9W56_03370, partial [Alphaproteobacteria bacterium]|nr:hypothetical protein [Alphaproteobacteria bacterium]
KRMSSAETIEEVPDIDGDNPPRVTRALVGHHSQQENFLSAFNGQRMPHAADRPEGGRQGQFRLFGCARRADWWPD